METDEWMTPSTGGSNEQHLNQQDEDSASHYPEVGWTYLIYYNISYQLQYSIASLL